VVFRPPGLDLLVAGLRMIEEGAQQCQDLLLLTRAVVSLLTEVAPD
jgi:hypothetical protein